ncbi:MAG TPA: cytochrome b562 [Opitutaceae bacterium]|nr:cytochrome b562 [Opitutaceae bacterium]
MPRDDAQHLADRGVGLPGEVDGRLIFGAGKRGERENERQEEKAEFHRSRAAVPDGRGGWIGVVACRFRRRKYGATKRRRRSVKRFVEPDALARNWLSLMARGRGAARILSADDPSRVAGPGREIRLRSARRLFFSVARPTPTHHMKNRLLLVTLICGLVAAPFIRAEDRPMQKEEQTELGDHMEKISGAFRALGRQIGDATKNEDSLKRIAVIREQAEAAMKLDPAKKADIPADQQAKFVADYQAKMKAFIADVNKVEAALKAGNNDEAKNLLQSLKQDQKEGHTEFQKKKKKM